MSKQHEIEVGDILHGFQSGTFGRDSGCCRRVEAVGKDWVLTRATGAPHYQSEVEMVTGESLGWLRIDAECPDPLCELDKDQL
jgi:hypothetical protein